MRCLFENRKKDRFLLHEFVIMPDHFHGPITPAAQVPLEKAMQFIKGGFSYRAGKELNVSFAIWQPGFTDHRIRDVQDYEQHRSYIHENPVKGRLVDAPELFPPFLSFSWDGNRSCTTMAKAGSPPGILPRRLKAPLP
jgi:putative transposase